MTVESNTVPHSFVFERPPLADWANEFAALSAGERWPSIADLEALRRASECADGIARPHFVAQSRAVLADGLHYEQRILGGRIATRENNWHDLLNALVWLRYPRTKAALNAAQCADIEKVGPRQRTRAQCAMTHFDEAGAIVLCSDPELIALWDEHDWHGMFWRRREAWNTRIAVLVFGHAILELALQAERFLVAKCIALAATEEQLARLATNASAGHAWVDARIARAIAAGDQLRDPQELRPLPLSGIPGWNPGAANESFFAEAPCFRPLRPGRRYPQPERA